MNRIEFSLLLLLLMATKPGWADPSVDRTLADTGIIFIQDSNQKARLVVVQPSVTESYGFEFVANEWKPASASNTLLVKRLGLRFNSERGKWQAAFGGIELPAKIGWDTFWNEWISKLSRTSGPQIVSYTDDIDKQRHLLLEKISATEWQNRETKDFLGKLGAEASEAPEEALDDSAGVETSVTLTSGADGAQGQVQGKRSWRSQYGGAALYITATVFFLVSIFLLWRIRKPLSGELRRSLLRLVNRIFPVSKDAITFEELLYQVHRNALDQIRSQSITDTEKNFRAGAMEHVLQSYVAAAAQLVPHPLIFAERELVTSSTKQPHQETSGLASLGNAALALCMERKRVRDSQEASDFLAAELKRLDTADEELEAARDQIHQLSQDLAESQRAGTKAAQEVKKLHTEKGNLEIVTKRLDGQLARQQRDLEEERGAHKKTAEERNALAMQINEITQATDRKVEEEKVRNHKALEEKELAFADAKKTLEEAKQKVEVKAQQLERDLALVTVEKQKAEDLVRTLNLTMESERMQHVDQTKRRQALEAKMARIFQANNYFRGVQRAYWDACKHPVSTGAILYNTYLGLFQAVAGAASDDSTLESTGWTNLMNLLRRLAQVPGLEQYQQDFGPRVFPEIETIQIQGIVDNNRADPERFVHSSVLQALLSGEIQVDSGQRNSFSLDRLRGWPLYFRVDQNGAWGAT